VLVFAKAIWGGHMKLKNLNGSALVFFIIIIIVAVLAFPFLKGVIQGFGDAKNNADQAFCAAMLMGVSAAINTYYEVNDSYPLMLDSLLNPVDGPPYTSEDSLNIEGYEYDYSSLFDNFQLRLNPTSGKGIHYYTDKTRKIRYNKNSPANENSSFL